MALPQWYRRQFPPQAHIPLLRTRLPMTVGIPWERRRVGLLPHHQPVITAGLTTGSANMVGNYN